MENPGGRVVFTHKAHSTPGGAYGDVACAVCHHELKISPASPEAGAQPAVMLCTDCHGTTDIAGFIASHQAKYEAKGGDASCISCHHARFAGYAEGWNHEEHKDYTGDDCQACHHEERYTAPSGKSMTIKPQKCANCHTAKPNPLASTTLKDAVHPKCNECHSDWFDDKLAGCAKCHDQRSLQKEFAQGKLDKKFSSCASCHGEMPGSMDAFHNSCMGCHDKVGKGPGKKAPCAQCHLPPR